jgi:carbon-monoxide dehydrogenase medium subunit
MLYSEYFIPNSLMEALELLDEYQGQSKIIAGGSDLIPQLKDEPNSKIILIDITRIPDLQDIHQNGEIFIIGSTVTHSSVERSKEIWLKATALAEAAKSIGSVQIRNVGTVGGNVVSALPAGDVALALVALEASAEVCSTNDTCEEKILDLYQGIGLSNIDTTKEIITHFKVNIPTHKNFGSAFMRISKRKGMSLPMLNCAVAVVLDDEIINHCRIVTGPTATIPFRATLAENILIGEKISNKLIDHAAKKASTESRPRESVFRGSAAYRKAMVEILVKRSLLRAIERARI